MPADWRKMLDNYKTVTGKPRTDFFKEVSKQSEFQRAMEKVLKNGKR